MRFFGVMKARDRYHLARVTTQRGDLSGKTTQKRVVVEVQTVSLRALITVAVLLMGAYAGIVRILIDGRLGEWKVTQEKELEAFLKEMEKVNTAQDQSLRDITIEHHMIMQQNQMILAKVIGANNLTKKIAEKTKAVPQTEK